MLQLQRKNRMDGGLLMKYDYTKLLDNIMIYWVTNSITTSVRLYAESFGKEFCGLGKCIIFIILQNSNLIEFFFDFSILITVPTACVKFENEVLPQLLAKDTRERFYIHGMSGL
ncbi:hypothetical protein MML48_1g12484 [Holotrichia oblita]|uniref:Uncharacterized protein n=1 Tax=Holotrichia oblita TaxID=644536 RepID=A0ACB9TZ17_HOLOL|nr:hypothetical protein MML48_1g12484 [Holotrichia oblita]